MKCREYETFSVLCQKCDILNNIGCSKSFNYNSPQKYIIVRRRDHLHMSWNECPTCGSVIGHPRKDIEFRCRKCGQKILCE